MVADEPTVIIADAPCTIRERKIFSNPYHTDAETCIMCGTCHKIGCPAIEKDEDSKRIAGKQIIDARDMIHGESYGNIKKRYSNLKRELSEAEDNNDLGRVEIIEKELGDLTKHITSSLNKYGKSRQFSDEIIKAKNILAVIPTTIPPSRLTQCLNVQNKVCSII